MTEIIIVTEIIIIIIIKSSSRQILQTPEKWLSIIAAGTGCSFKAGFLKLWVTTCKWVPEPTHMGRENYNCKYVTVMTSVSLASNKTGAVYDYLTRANQGICTQWSASINNQCNSR